jgi:hypothetical protein
MLTVIDIIRVMVCSRDLIFVDCDDDENELKLTGLSACMAGGSVHTKRAEVWRIREVKAREGEVWRIREVKAREGEVWRIREVKAREGEAKEREEVSSSLRGTAYCR